MQEQFEKRCRECLYYNVYGGPGYGYCSRNCGYMSSNLSYIVCCKDFRHKE